MHPLYPPIKPNKSYELPVGLPHVLYIEECGNPQGLAVLVLHSPGAGSDPSLRRFFDPEIYRIILFDQRGSGRSTPHAELESNDTEALLKDIEALRNYLEIDHFMLFGCSFGTMLALLYAERYPDQVSALLLEQIFLGRRKNLSWFYQNGANQIYPDYWQEFVSFVPQNEQHNILGYYAQCLQGNNELMRMSAAKSWALWRARCVSLQPHFNLIEQYCDPHFALAFASIESHFLLNNYFIEEDQIVNNINKISHIPTYLIHGRYNMVSPLENAWTLHQAHPLSFLKIIRDAGSSYHEPGIIDAIIDAAIELSRQQLNVS